MDELRLKLARILEMAHHRGVASAMSLFVGDLSGLDIELHHGDASPSTAYDLASITKILGTTLSLARAIADGRISLDEKPFAAWPKATMRALLRHCTGLPAHVKFYEEPGVSNDVAKNRRIMLSKLFSIKPEGQPEYLYCDLDFIALGLLLEERFRQPLDEIFFGTLQKQGIREQFFHCPSTFRAESRAGIASTGFCPKRRMMITGQVHDLNCYFLGGLAGHAGLFGTLADIKSFGRYLLKMHQAPRAPIGETLRSWAQNGLGFQKPTLDGTTSALSARSFGHFGFTGVSLWIDPQARGKKGIIIALLTNRVMNGIRPEEIFWLRKKICDAIINAC